MAGLEQSIDEIAIHDLTVVYCWALDTREFEKLREIFLEDCTALYGPRELLGVQAVMDRCRQALAPLDASQHMVTNHRINIDGDRATSRCYFHAQHVRGAAAVGDASPNFIVAGHYNDDLVRSADGWRIQRRVLVSTWTAGNPIVVNPAADSAS